MRLKNNTVSNQSVYSTIGSKTARKYITIVGESTLELEDDVWLNEYEDSCKALIEAGTLEIIKAPKKTDEQIAKEKAEAIAAAKKLLATEEKAGK